MNKKNNHFKSLIKVQFAITYIDSRIRNPLGQFDPMIATHEIDGQIMQSLPKTFILRMCLEAVEVRNTKSRSKKPLKIILGYTTDLMDGGQLFHRPYTKKEIEKMRTDEEKRQKRLEESLEEFQKYNE